MRSNIICFLFILFSAVNIHSQDIEKVEHDVESFLDSVRTLQSEDIVASYDACISFEDQLKHIDTLKILKKLRDDMIYYSFELGNSDETKGICYRQLKNVHCNVKDSIYYYLNIGNCFYRSGEPDSSIYFYNKGVVVCERNDLPANMPALYRGISTVFLSEQNFSSALEYLDMAIEEIMVKKDSTLLSELIYVKASTLQQKGDQEAAKIMFFEGLKYAKRDIYKALNHYGISSCYEEMSIDTALIHIQLAEQFAPKDLSNFQRIYILSKKAKLLNKKNKVKEAKEIIDQIYPRYIESEGQYLNHESGFYQTRGEVYFKLKNYKIAYESQVKLQSLSDSIKSIDKSEAVQDIIEKYNNEKIKGEVQQLKEAQKANEKIRIAEEDLKKADKERAQIRTLIFIVTAVLLLVIIFLLLFFFRSLKKRSNLLTMANNNLKESKDQIENQKVFLEKQAKKIDDSIRYAKNIQNAMVPSKSAFMERFTDSFILFQPKDEVSGDFIWYGQKGDDLYILVADCTGHGVPGALISVICLNIVEDVFESCEDITTADFLNRVGQGLSKKVDRYENHTNEIKDGMDASLLKINLVSGKCSFSGARNGALIVQNNEIIEVKADRTSIGGRQNDEEYNFTNKEFVLNSGDMIYLYTDGYVDQKGGPRGKKFYRKPFMNMVLSISKEAGSKQFDKVNSTLMEWKGAHEQLDDITLLGFRFFK
jgi:serine phosphatase RsbU (regulator of sigma subunit)